MNHSIENTMKNILIKTLLIIGCLSVVACQQSSPNGEGAAEENSDQAATQTEDTTRVTLTQAQIKNADITVGAFQEISLGEIIVANGYVTLPPNGRASINAPLEGFIERVYFQEGAQVKKGKALVQLKHPQFIQLQQDYLQALSSFGYLEKELERQQTLAQANVSAQKKLQQTQADFDSAKATRNALAEKLRFMGINPAKVQKGNIQASIYLRAPFTGVVTQVQAYRGQLVSPQQAILEMINQEEMQLALKVFEKDIRKVKEGEPLVFAVPSYENAPAYEGTVALVGQDLERESRAITVYGHIQDKSGLIPGLYVEAQITAGSKKARALPNQAIIREGEAQYFFVQQPGDSQQVTFERVKFQPGSTSPDYTEIVRSDPIPDSLAIVLSGAFYLKSAMNVGEGDEE